MTTPKSWPIGHPVQGRQIYVERVPTQGRTVYWYVIERIGKTGVCTMNVRMKTRRAALVAAGLLFELRAKHDFGVGVIEAAKPTQEGLGW